MKRGRGYHSKLDRGYPAPTFRTLNQLAAYPLHTIQDNGGGGAVPAGGILGSDNLGIVGSDGNVVTGDS